ncbi:uncharacterized protein PgNI_04730, partial [Pyricularia grisea]|uniref:Uncharacterized protein n=1 Tax=Pyricularia grisea TaxID=148305 RepID=A0A6P8BC57_PYRGI
PSPQDGLIYSNFFLAFIRLCPRGQANPSACRVKKNHHFARTKTKIHRNTHDLEEKKDDGRAIHFYCTVLHRTAPTSRELTRHPPSLATTSCSHHITFPKQKPTGQLCCGLAADRAATYDKRGRTQTKTN